MSDNPPKPCWNCGGTTWERGDMTSHTGFRPEHLPAFTLTGLLSVSAQVCMDCGLLVPYLSEIELDRLRRWREKN